MTSLSKIIFDEGIQSINDQEFFNFTNLKEVQFPSSLTTIKQKAFVNSGIVSLQINNVTNIELQAFASCLYLEEVIFGNNLEQLIIGDYAFVNCKSLKMVTFPNFPIYFGTYAFSGMNKVEEIHILASYSGRNNCPFYCMSDLKKVIFDYGIETIYKQEFKFCANLQEIIFPETLRYIQEEGLYYTGLLTVHLPILVQEIGKSAFAQCCSLKEITFNDWIMFLPESCFEGSFNFSEINLPSRLTTIKPNCFKDAKITFITFPSSLEQIQKDAFNNCKYLNMSLNFPYNLSYIGRSAFYNCELINEITIPSNLTNRSPGCFSYITGLEKVIFESGITEIYYEEYAYCINLKEIILPASLLKIQENAFMNSGLESISIPIQCKNIGKAAFKNCYSLNEVILNGNFYSLPISCFENGIKLKTFNFPSGLRVIDNYCFMNCSFETITLPNSIDEIKDYAFYNCSFLKSFDFPNKAYSFGRYSLGGTNLIEELFIPHIWGDYRGSHLFDGMINLKKVIFQDGVVSICYGEFANCIHLTEVQLPQSLTAIRAHAFNNTGFIRFILPDIITDLGESVFSNCFSLKEFIFNKNKYIPSSFFKNSFNYTEFIIPPTVREIWESCFENCKLISIHIPDSIRYFKRFAFYNCYTPNILQLPPGPFYLYDFCFSGSHLDKILTLTTNHTQYGAYFFENCTDIEKVIISDQIKIIRMEIFANCINLKEIILPNDIEIINERAFMGTKLHSVILPESVTEIGVGVFMNCYYLKNIILGSNIIEFIIVLIFVACKYQIMSY